MYTNGKLEQRKREKERTLIILRKRKLKIRMERKVLGKKILSKER
jgi:hypothetical protein